MALHEEHKQRVRLIEGIQDREEIAWVAVRGDGEEVAERWREEGGELLLGEDFEEGGFELVEAVLETLHVLHGGLWEWRAIASIAALRCTRFGGS